MNYSVVEFVDGIHLVPTNWIFQENDKNMCWWPPLNDKFHINKLIINKRHPEKNWRKYQLTKIFCEAATYEKGTEKLNLAMLMSDVETDQELELKKSRHERHSQYLASDSESENEVRTKKRPLQKSKPNQPEVVNLDEMSTCRLPSFPKKPDSFSNEKTDGRVIARANSISEIFSTPTSSYCRSEVDIDLKPVILNKLNLVIQRLEAIEDRLSLIEQGKANPQSQLSLTTPKELYKTFPLIEHADLDKFEEELQLDSYFQDMINEFVTIGGTNVQSITVNVLKQLISNKIANDYSLQGKKKKRIFRNLLSYQLIVAVVRRHRPGTTEIDVSGCIAAWLNQSGLRLLRETGKSTQRN